MIYLSSHRLFNMQDILLEQLKKAYFYYKSGNFVAAREAFYEVYNTKHSVLNMQTIECYLRLCDIKLGNSNLVSSVENLRKAHLSRTEQKEAKNKYIQLKNLIIASQLFDPEYYKSQNSDVRNSSIDPLDHYCEFGYLESRDPHPHFNAKFFRLKLFQINKDLVGFNPLSTYLDLPPNRKGLELTGSFEYLEYLTGLNKSLVPVDKLVNCDASKSIRIAIALHAFFCEGISLWINEIKKIPYDFYLIVTTDTIDKQLFIESAFAEANIDAYEILIVSNHGRDLLPFFKAFNRLKTLDGDFDYVLKLHIKQSLDFESSDPNYVVSWNELIIKSLLGSTENIIYIIENLLGRNSISLIAPLVPREVYSHCTWGDNLEFVQHLDPTIPLLDEDVDKCIDFPAGSMFWIKFDSLKFLDEFFDISLVPSEPIPKNGTYLHAFERLVPRILQINQHPILYHTDTSKNFLDHNSDTVRTSPYVSFKNIIDWKVNQVRTFVQQFHFNRLDHKIIFPHFSNPSFSIIIPAYKNYKITLQCLIALFLLRNEIDFEVIVIDDCSPDFASRTLDRIFDGIKLLRNESNLGFVGSCNRGSQFALSDNLLFLNNDTIPLEGSLISLFNNLMKHDVGLCGSMLLYENGSLQEAGGCIWYDGNALNYGRNSNPQDPIYLYNREVDYLSGASIAISKSLFDQLDGFDLLYSPGYYEDTDLAMKVRVAGYKVVYVYSSKVIHLEGMSSDGDESTGMKRFQAINKVKFFTKWQSALSTGFSKPHQNKYFYNRRANQSILFIDSYLPTPDKDSGSNDILNTMTALIGTGFEVHFVCSVEVVNGSSCYIDDLRSRGIITHVQQYKHHVASIIEKIVHDIDVCFIARYDNWNKFYNFILNISDHISFIFDTVDLHHIRYQREADLALLVSKNSLEVNAIEKAEMTAIAQADNVLLRSTSEIDYLVNRSIDRKKLHLFPICRDIIPSSVGFDDRNGFLFLGGFLHTPNIDAVKFFLEEIFPEVRRLDSSLKFYIAGSHSELLIDSLGNDLHSDGVEVIGYVSDLRFVFDQVKFSVAPLRYGAGTKGKVISSMCHGLPCIATSIAVEGLRDLKNGCHVLIENDSSAFAEQIVNLHSNPKLWQDLSSNSLEYASQTSSLDTLNSCLKGIMENVTN